MPDFVSFGHATSGRWAATDRFCGLTKLVAALALGATVSLAHAQVYKCTDESGRTTYSDAPCAAGVKPHPLPEDPTRGVGTNPHMCAQLLDETRRLAAEVDRNARRGIVESKSAAERRAALTKRYEAR